MEPEWNPCTFIIWVIMAVLFIVALAALIINEWEAQEQIKEKDKDDLTKAKRR